jgi:hypothetical protein
MPCLSYLKFPSFTDNACNSLTLDAVANAIKNTVFHVKNFTSQDKRGSKGGSHNLQSTEGKSQLGRSGFKIGFELKIPLINFERSPLVLTERPPQPLCFELIADQQFSSKASKYMEQSIRSSTRRLYSVRWEIFSSWCAERQISPTSASVGNVADFFVYLHSVKKCKVATIIGYRSVLEEHPLLTPEVEETKTDVELRALPEELSNSLV